MEELGGVITGVFHQILHPPGVDYESKEFVVFDKTLDTTYHGHVRSWKDLHPDMQKALQQAGMADRKGNILVGGKQ